MPVPPSPCQWEKWEQWSVFYTHQHMYKGTQSSARKLEKDQHPRHSPWTLSGGLWHLGWSPAAWEIIRRWGDVQGGEFYPHCRAPPHQGRTLHHPGQRCFFCYWQQLMIKGCSWKPRSISKVKVSCRLDSPVARPVRKGVKSFYDFCHMSCALETPRFQKTMHVKELLYSINGLD